MQSYLATVCSEHEDLVLLFQHDWLDELEQPRLRREHLGLLQIRALARRLAGKLSFSLGGRRLVLRLPLARNDNEREG